MTGLYDSGGISPAQAEFHATSNFKGSHSGEPYPHNHPSSTLDP
jgi:hypothetical protein